MQLGFSSVGNIKKNRYTQLKLQDCLHAKGLQPRQEQHIYWVDALEESAEVWSWPVTVREADIPTARLEIGTRARSRHLTLLLYVVINNWWFFVVLPAYSFPGGLMPLWTTWWPAVARVEMQYICRILLKRSFCSPRCGKAWRESSGRFPWGLRWKAMRHSLCWFGCSESVSSQIRRIDFIMQMNLASIRSEGLVFLPNLMSSTRILTGPRPRRCILIWSSWTLFESMALKCLKLLEYCKRMITYSIH